MPVYTDPSTGKRIRSSESLSDTELEEAFSGGGGGDQSTWYGRAGQYVEHKANEFVSSGQNLLADLTGQAQPAGRTNWERAGDVLTVGAPVIAPGLTAAGVGAGAATRAFGGSEDTANLVNAGTQLAAGLGGAAYKGIKAATGAKAAAEAQYEALRGTAAQEGYALRAGTPAGFKLKASLEELVDTPGFLKPGEKPILQSLVAKLSVLPSSGKPLSKVPGVTYADLDQAITNLGAGKSYAKSILRDAVSTMLEGTPQEGARAAAGKAYRLAANPIWRQNRGLAAAGGIGIGGAAGWQIAQGHYKRGLMTAGAAGLGMLSPGGLRAGLGAMAGPLARTAVAGGAASVPLMGGEQADIPESENPAPAQPETPEAPTAPQIEEPAPSEDVAQAVPQGRYGREIAAVAQLAGVPAPFLQSVITQESSGNVDALSHPEADQVQTPAHGIMQVTPGTFEAVRKPVETALGRKAHVDNPLDNLLAGAFLWRRYLEMANGDVRTAAFLYHGGENPQAWGHHTMQYGADISRRFASAARAAPTPSQQMQPISEAKGAHPALRRAAWGHVGPYPGETDQEYGVRLEMQAQSGAGG